MVNTVNEPLTAEPERGPVGENAEFTQVIYASAATIAFKPTSLAELLAAARQHNEACEVTGLLVYFEGSFLQVLEGPQDDVDLLYQAIQRDRRHANCRLLLRSVISEREFGEWSMGFADPRQIAAELDGYVNVGSGLTALVQDTDRAKDILTRFRDGAWH